MSNAMNVLSEQVNANVAMAAELADLKAAPVSKAAFRRQEALEAQIAALQAENARLQAAPLTRALLRSDRPKAAPKPSLKVTAKGGVSLYGLGRFPVTLYKSQWEKLLAQAPAIQAFLAENEAVLSVKE